MENCEQSHDPQIGEATRKEQEMKAVLPLCPVQVSEASKRKL